MAPSLLVTAGPGGVAATAAELVANRVRARPALRLTLPSGRTPVGMYAALRAHAVDGSLPTERAAFFALDEYRGLGAGDRASFRTQLEHELRGIPFARFRVLDGRAPDAGAECARYQALLDAAPLDLAVLGLGGDGHVAFNEPGSDAQDDVREVALDAATRRAAAAGFDGVEQVPTHALTIGLRTLLAARELLVLVTGTAKAQALRRMLTDTPSPAWPASLLRGHPRLTILCDRAAAVELDPDPAWDSDHVAVVLGHREPGISAEHRISRESLDRLHRAEWLTRRILTRAVVLTGYTSTAGLSEAEQMAQWWTTPRVPRICEVAGRDTAENASRSLPLILALGGVRRVTVVTSAWHVRAPYHFAPYRRHGLELGFRRAWAQGRWPQMVANELVQIPVMPRDRRRAFARLRLPTPVTSGHPYRTNRERLSP